MTLGNNRRYSPGGSVSSVVLRVFRNISSLNTAKVFDECLLKAKYVFLCSDSELLVWLELGVNKSVLDSSLTSSLTGI